MLYFISIAENTLDFSREMNQLQYHKKQSILDRDENSLPREICFQKSYHFGDKRFNLENQWLINESFKYRS